MDLFDSRLEAVKEKQKQPLLLFFFTLFMPLVAIDDW